MQVRSTPGASAPATNGGNRSAKLPSSQTKTVEDWTRPVPQNVARAYSSKPSAITQSIKYETFGNTNPNAPSTKRTIAAVVVPPAGNPTPRPRLQERPRRPCLILRSP